MRPKQSFKVLCVCVCVRVRVCVRVYVCACVCVCIHTPENSNVSRHWCRSGSYSNATHRHAPSHPIFLIFFPIFFHASILIQENN